jgi:hypothetical protein
MQKRKKKTPTASINVLNQNESHRDIYVLCFIKQGSQNKIKKQE